jgi:hypothetical protein
MSRPVPDTDLDFTSRLNQCIDLANKRISDEVPHGIIPDFDTVFLYKEYSTGDAEDGVHPLVSTTADSYVLDFGSSAIIGGFNIVVDGTWDGIYWLEVTLPNGKIYIRQSREWWNEVGQGFNHQYVSLVQPIADTFVNAKVRIYQPFIYLSQDVTEVKEGTLFNNAGMTLETLPEGFARDTGWLDNSPIINKGRPVALARSKHFQLDAPNRKPTVTTDIVGGFAPEGRGTFKYRYTYAWGRRDPLIPTEAGTLYPMWESSPSPESDATLTVGNSLVVSLANIDWEIGFDTPGTLRQTHSGLVKRIYRSRQTVTTGTVTAIEAPSVYQFIAEVGGEVTSWTDDGTKIPEYYSRLPEISGYYAWRSVPAQNDTYQMQLRCNKRARELANDYDAIKVSPECIDAFLFLCLHYMSFYDDDQAKAQYWYGMAEEQIGRFRARHANPVSVIPGQVWGVGQNSWSSWAPNLTWSRFS